MPAAERQLLGVKDVRTLPDGRVEGLCMYDDGTEEWRPPSNVSVEVVNERTGEAVEISDVKIGGVPCG